MTTKNHRLLLVITSLLLCGHHNTAFSAKNRAKVKNEYYENNVLMMTYSVQNKRLNGPYKMYYQNGNLATEGTYLNGVRFGEWTEWHPNGEMALTLRYDSSGTENGAIRSWWTNGQPALKGSYTEGIWDGIWSYQNEKGKLVGKCSCSANFTKGDAPFNDSSTLIQKRKIDSLFYFFCRYSAGSPVNICDYLKPSVPFHFTIKGNDSSVNRLIWQVGESGDTRLEAFEYDGKKHGTYYLFSNASYCGELEDCTTELDARVAGFYSNGAKSNLWTYTNSMDSEYIYYKKGVPKYEFSSYSNEKKAFRKKDKTEKAKSSMGSLVNYSGTVEATLITNSEYPGRLIGDFYNGKAIGTWYQTNNRNDTIAEFLFNDNQIDFRYDYMGSQATGSLLNNLQTAQGRAFLVVKGNEIGHWKMTSSNTGLNYSIHFKRSSWGLSDYELYILGNTKLRKYTVCSGIWKFHHQEIQNGLELTFHNNMITSIKITGK